MSIERTTSRAVLEAIEDLHAQEQIVTRETLAEVTGLKLAVIDDRVSYLIDTGDVHRVQRGVFVPAPKHRPARAISKTLLPDGTTLLEFGDEHAVVLTPRENRMLGEIMTGAGEQFARIESGHQAAMMASELKQQVAQLRSELKTARGEMRAAREGAELLPSGE